ncbi:MAG: hypothetical protein NTW21_09235, partial [Verrucomicrobia bacterium]|nr:hypothetical protein [Verrucomicrobiota bacterium]
LGVAVPAYNSTFTLNVPRTLTQTLTGTNLQLSCPTVTGLNYQLQGSDDCVTWSNLGASVAGNGSPWTQTLSTTSAPVRFYRMALSD